MIQLMTALMIALLPVLQTRATDEAVMVLTMQHVKVIAPDGADWTGVEKQLDELVQAGLQERGIEHWATSPNGRGLMAFTHEAVARVKVWRRWDRPGEFVRYSGLAASYLSDDWVRFGAYGEGRNYSYFVARTDRKLSFQIERGPGAIAADEEGRLISISGTTLYIEHLEQDELKLVVERPLRLPEGVDPSTFGTKLIYCNVGPFAVFEYCAEPDRTEPLVVDTRTGEVTRFPRERIKGLEGERLLLLSRWDAALQRVSTRRGRLEVVDEIELPPQVKAPSDVRASPSGRWAYCQRYRLRTPIGMEQAKRVFLKIARDEAEFSHADWPERAVVAGWITLEPTGVVDPAVKNDGK